MMIGARTHLRRLGRDARLSAGSLGFWGRVTQFLLGLTAMGLGLAVMLEAGVGIGPWGVFHQGLARVTPLSFGQALMAVGVLVVSLAWLWTGQRPGPGTFVNMVIVGPWVDVFRTSGLVPAPEAFLPGVAQFLVGLTITGVASGMYITARFGAGPRDGFVLGLSRLLGGSVRRTRTVLEIAVLSAGFLLGGTVGVGTALFAALIGPIMQFALRLFTRLPSPAVRPAAGD